MTNEITQLYGISSTDLLKGYEKITSLITELKDILAPPDKYLTRKEIAELLNISVGTVHNWTNSGRLTKYMIGRRAYYKQSDIDRAMVKLNIC